MRSLDSRRQPVTLSQQLKRPGSRSQPTLPRIYLFRAYPLVAKQGRAWGLAGRYWIAYVTRPSLAIFAMFYEAADIPSRS